MYVHSIGCSNCIADACLTPKGGGNAPGSQGVQQPCSAVKLQGTAGQSWLNDWLSYPCEKSKYHQIERRQLSELHLIG